MSNTTKRAADRLSLAAAVRRAAARETDPALKAWLKALAAGDRAKRNRIAKTTN